MKAKSRISMTEARTLLAEKSNGQKKPVDIKNPEVFESGLFEVISGPGSEAKVKTDNWVLEIK